MKAFALKYKRYFTNERFLWMFFSGAVLFLASLFINFYAGVYATEKASNAVTDVILNNIRLYDVDHIFVISTFIFVSFVGLLCLKEPKRFPFILKSAALFALIRSIFISLTHLGPFPTHVTIDPSSFISNFTSGSDLFFSGHTGLPFLMGLIFWNNRYLRVLFFTTSVFFGAVVPLGHLHYSIDVASAFFITYTIYILAEKFFKKDKEIFSEGIN
ncbi:MAG: hypothetical protein CEN90_703 [Parcubacteria group bacterium Licking1014_17]|nr:MAG: hypothetical protein CEN90_703 [Parcubacteria group bacterium Licking1014_17]